MSGDPLDLDAIEARANAATEGPWYWEPDTDESWPQGANSLRSSGKRNTYTSHDGTQKHYDAEVVGSWGHDAWGVDADDDDAEFIAHAREDVPTLVAEVRRLRRWKDEALPVMEGLQELGGALGLPLGTRITGRQAFDAALDLRSEVRRLSDTVERVEWLRRSTAMDCDIVGGYCELHCVETDDEGRCGLVAMLDRALSP